MTKKNIKLSEEDLKKLFRKPNYLASFWYDFSAFVKYLGQFALVFFIFFLILNFPAFIKRAKFVLAPEPAPQLETEPKTKINPASFQKQNIKPPPKIPKQASENRIFIPTIEVDAPIIWNSPPETILDDLQNGVAHYKGTSVPGEFGNVFLTGHSSNYWWDKGKFNQVFALLDKLDTGDKIYLGYKEKVYIYEVEKKRVVKPTNIEVLNPQDHSVVTLMTCTPVGTTINRLIVQARQIYPEPAPKAKQTIPLQNPDTLPAIR